MATTMRAVWKGQVLAESNDTVVVEGNHYFPASSLRGGFFADSTTTSICPWKGQAHYKSVEVDGEVNPDAAWYYPEPKAEAESIRGRFAFWRGVEVVPS